MRSRPEIKTYLRPAISRPGETLHVEVALKSKTETPVDFVEMRLEGTERAQFGRYGSRSAFLALTARHGERVLGVGEHRLAARFALPANLPPTYSGGAGSIDYTLAVHVSIPWWPDRRQTFTVPVAAIAKQVEPTPLTIVSSLEGPRGGAPYIEASFDSTTLVIGGELAGAISVSNVSGATIRGVDLELHATESSKLGMGTYEPRVLRWHIHDGAPPEAQPIPFRVALTRDLGVSLAMQLFELQWRLEVVVRVAWGFDAKLEVPVTLVAAGAPPSRAAARRWVAPVGRERRALVWATVADKHGMVNDADAERMTASIGATTLTVHLQQRGGDGLFAIANVAYGDLGLDLRVERRSWTDALARTVDLGDDEPARHVTVRAREAAQARALFDDHALRALAAFEEVRIDDEGATLAMPSGATTGPQLDRFVGAAIHAARMLANGIARVPPPAKMAAAVPAWEALAERVGGRLDRGAMRVRDAALGGDAIEVATLWTRDAGIEGTAVRVRLSPPLERAIDVASPELSPEARELANAIAADAKRTRLGPDALEALVAGPLEDPAVVEPLLEKLSRLARAARGVPATGPFR